MNDKPFKTYNQQMKHLRESKLLECSGSEDKEILAKCGYFNLINGYKDPFVQSVDSNGKHTYIGKTSIKHFYYVKEFDDELRSILLKNLTKVEEEIRTLVSHKFDYINNKGKISWFDIEAYNENVSIQQKMRVISKCYEDIERNKMDYTKHYIDNHSSIPTWIFIKTIQFSNFINFIDICKPEIPKSICKLYSIYDKNGIADTKLLISILHLLRKSRNACAHNERIYCLSFKNNRISQPFLKFAPKHANYLKHRTQRIVDLILFLRYFMCDKEYKTMIIDIENIFIKLQSKINRNVFNKIRASTGIRDLSLFETLKNTKHTIKYSSLENID